MRISAPQNGFDLGFPVDSSAVLGELLRTYLAAAKGAYSKNTERAIRADVAIFSAWCKKVALPALPARTATVVAFIDAMAQTRAPATVRRYVSSIATVHKANRLRNPLESARAKLALQRMHRLNGRRQSQVLGLTWPLRQRLLEASGDRLIDARNRALLAVAYDSLLRRSELVALQVADLFAETDGTATILVRCGKTDPEGDGTMLYVHGDSVKLLRAWLRGAGILSGALFRSVRKGGTVSAALHPSQIPRIYKSMAANAGLPREVVDALSGHSTRVGPVQDMIAAGIDLPAILQAGRWKSIHMVQRYGERLLAKRSAAARLARLQGRP